jgi:pentapeptide repeat protein
MKGAFGKFHRRNSMVFGIKNTRIAAKSIFRTVGLVLLLSILVARGFPASVQAAGPSPTPTLVVVNESHMHGWAFVLTDSSGVPYHTGGDYASATGTAQFVAGPSPAPDGTGSANLAVGDGTTGGDGSAKLGTANFDGTALASLTTLSYYAYSAQNNGQQFPYLTLSITTGDAYSSDCSGTGGTNPLACSQDKLFFEPPYQTPTSGSPACPNQGPTLMNTWQNWDAFHGCWWDANGIGNPGTGVLPLSAFLAAYPGAIIKSFTASGNTFSPGVPRQGLAFTVGFTSATDIENGNVDFFFIGISGEQTHYDFEHIIACPRQGEDASQKQEQHEELCEQKGDHGEQEDNQAESEDQQTERSQQNSDLSNEDLNNANFNGYDFSNSNLQGADLSGSSLRNVNLSGADLSCADLENADLSGANLLGAIIRGADLTGANLQGVDLSGVISVGSLICGGI